MLDVGYVLAAGVGKSHGNVRFALKFRPELILPSLRISVLLLVAAAILALLSRAPLAVKATVAGFALANALFGFSNVFLPAEAQMLEHPHYVIALTTWLPLFFFGWNFMGAGLVEKLNRWPLRAALMGALGLVGVWEGFVGYRSNLSVNLLQASAIRELTTLMSTAKDLVIAPAQFSDDISSWIPLLSPAIVLYTSDGENILSASDTQKDQTLRQAVYLSATGMTTAALTAIIENAPDYRLNSLVQQNDRAYQRSPLAADRMHARGLVKDRLEPVLARIESDPKLVRTVLAGYERIIVLDGVGNPIFDPAAFSKWLKIDRHYEHNGVTVWICRLRVAS